MTLFGFDGAGGHFDPAADIENALGRVCVAYLIGAVIALVAVWKLLGRVAGPPVASPQSSGRPAAPRPAPSRARLPRLMEMFGDRTKKK